MERAEFPPQQPKLIISPEETNLVARAQQGEPDAFVELMETHKGRIHSFLINTIGEQDAHDLAQETWEKAFKKIQTYQPQAPIVYWFLTIARNTTISMLRKRNPNLTPIDNPAVEETLKDKMDVEEAVLSGVERVETGRILHRALDMLRSSDLRADQRRARAVELRYIEELDIPAIAKVLGTTETNSRVIIHRGLRQLRKELEADYQRRLA